jgi:hypothetical protein
VLITVLGPPVSATGTRGLRAVSGVFTCKAITAAAGVVKSGCDLVVLWLQQLLLCTQGNACYSSVYGSALFNHGGTHG